MTRRFLGTLGTAFLLASCGGSQPNSEHPAGRQDESDAELGESATRRNVPPGTYVLARRVQRPKPVRGNPSARGRDSADMNAVLEDAALSLLRFRKRTGRGCPSEAEQRAMGIHPDALSSTTHWISFACRERGGFALELWRRDELARRLNLESGCSSAPGYADATCDSEVFDTMADCSGGGECRRVSVDDWLSPVPAP